MGSVECHEFVMIKVMNRKAMKNFQPRFWAWYVDDTFVIIKREDKGRFPDVCADIQFTMEEGD